MLGPYRLFERLGAGGYACVYRARRIDDPLGPDVAIKRLHPHLIHDEAAIACFGREARIAYLLDHPVIRRVLALRREAGELFIAMELAEGVPLDRVLTRANLTRRRPPIAGVLALLTRLCEALHFAHEIVDERGAAAGFVHRDVSPSNLIVSPTGQLKLIDLGVARVEAAEHATNSGLVKGKYGYMAPEVLWSAPFDRRADVFSVGVVAWELLVCRRLFPIASPPVDLERVRARPIDPPSTRNPACPLALDAVILRALATDPAERWPTCAAMAEALRLVAASLQAALTDAAIASLLDVLAEVEAQVPPSPRLARGTCPPVALPLPAPPALAIAPRRDPTAPRRRTAPPFRQLSPALAAILLVTLGLAALFASSPPASTSAAVASPPVASPVPPPPVAPPPPAPAPLAPAEACDVIRIAGPWPRSRTAEYPYRARLCIDAAGTVTAVDVLAGPGRLTARITRALRRWRYQACPVATPRCFVIESMVAKTPARPALLTRRPLE